MKWSLTELRKNHRNDPLPFDETLDLKADLMERFSDDVLDLSPVHAKGIVSVVDGDVVVDARVTADLTVPSSRSLAPVDLPVDFNMTEFYVSDPAATQRFEKTDVVMVVKMTKSISIKPSGITLFYRFRCTFFLTLKSR